MLTAKFEPAARSWAQMPSGSGAPKRILSEQPLAAAIYIPLTAENSTKIED